MMIRTFPSLLSRLVLGLAATLSVSAQADQVRGQEQYDNRVLLLLEQYCYECHADGAEQGGFAMDKYPNYADLVKQQKFWHNVELHLAVATMPPEDKDQPTIEERNEILDWIKNAVFYADPSKPDPGRVTLRRLNREEYANTIKDIFGFEFDTNENFPPDDSGYGFDNIGDVLSTSPLLLEKYLDAATVIAGTAFDVIKTEPNRTPISRRRFKPNSGNPLITDSQWHLNSTSSIKGTLKPEVSGKYQLQFQIFATQAGDEPVKIQTKLDDKDLGIREVKEHKRVVPVTFELDLKDSGQEFEIGFTNDYYNEAAPDPDRRDRNMSINNITLIGPLPPVPKAASFIRWLEAEAWPQDQAQQTAFIHKIIRKMGRRIYRRVLTQQEVDRLSQVALKSLSQGKGPAESLASTLQVMLVSPHFLFRSSGPGSEPTENWNAVPVDEFTLASRISYFLWSSAPDDELLDLAEKGQLRQQLTPQLQRMLKDAKAERLISNFGGQWLKLRDLAYVTPDPRLFPDFTQELAADMRTETEMLIRHVFFDNKPVTLFLDADFSFINERLASHYQVENVSGNEFRKVSLASVPRRGILSHGSVLTINSDPTRTSPVKRGQWVLENIMGVGVPPPPQNVPPLAEQDRRNPKSVRETLAIHRENKACAACHALIDPVGFAFENFDAVGRWRDRDGNQPVDASGKLRTGEEFNDYLGFQDYLAKHRRDEFAKTFLKSFLTFALGRGVDYHDEPALEAIRAKAAQDDYHMHSIIQAVVESVPFQKRRG